MEIILLLQDIVMNAGDSDFLFLLGLVTSLWVVTLCAAYLCGSISIMRFICRIFQIKNLKSNSCYTGTTNFFRMGINLPTVLILFEDLLKGGVAGWIAVFLSKTSAPMIYEISVIPAFFLGHLFPVFSQIKGEKGFATFLGISFALNLSFGIYLIALWLIAVLTSKEWGLSAISVLFIAPFIAYFMFEDFGIAIEIYLLSSLSVYVYRGTIYRLCKDIKKKIS